MPEAGKSESNTAWDDRVRRLIRSARYSRIPVRKLQSIFPEIDSQLRRTIDSHWLTAWGLSHNVDENTGTQIVDRKILSLIGRVVRYPIRHQSAYHSGLMHVFGYLLSTIRTPYGHKRDRWIKRTIEKGLKLPDGFLVPGSQHPFFERVSQVLACVAWQNGRLEQDWLPVLKSVSPAIEEAINRWKIRRFREFPRKNGSHRVRSLNTDLVFTGESRKPLRAILVYSIQMVDSAFPLLQTCFSVGQQAIHELNQTGQNVPIRLRFNAYVDGFPASGETGRRTVEEFPARPLIKAARSGSKEIQTPH